MLFIQYHNESLSVLPLSLNNVRLYMSAICPLLSFIQCHNESLSFFPFAVDILMLELFLWYTVSNTTFFVVQFSKFILEKQGNKIQIIIISHFVKCHLRMYVFICLSFVLYCPSYNTRTSFTTKACSFWPSFITICTHLSLDHILGCMLCSDV